MDKNINIIKGLDSRNIIGPVKEMAHRHYETNKARKLKIKKVKQL